MSIYSYRSFSTADILLHNLGAPSYDDVMNHNKLTTRFVSPLEYRISIQVVIQTMDSDLSYLNGSLIWLCVIWIPTNLTGFCVHFIILHGKH